MKNYLALVFLSLIVPCAKSQQIKTFRVGVGSGFAKSGGEGASGGVQWTCEPGYHLKDNLLLNLRVELATVVRGTVEPTGTNFDVAALSSYTLNAQYYVSDKRFRPFVALGGGLYRMAAIVPVEPPLGGGSSGAAAESKFGFYPRLGFDAGHFTLCIDYNLIPPTTGKVFTSNGTTTTEFKNSYIGIRLGGFFGGGRN